MGERSSDVTVQVPRADLRAGPTGPAATTEPCHLTDALDFSAGGMRIGSVEGLAAGMRVHLVLMLPSGDSLPGTGC